MSSFGGSPLETWLAEHHRCRSKYYHTIPVFTTTSPEHLSHVAQPLRLANGADTGKQSYIKFAPNAGSTYTISISGLETFDRSPTARADDYRLESSSYIQLMRAFNLQPQAYTDVTHRSTGLEVKTQTLNSDTRDSGKINASYTSSVLGACTTNKSIKRSQVILQHATAMAAKFERRGFEPTMQLQLRRQIRFSS